MPTLTTPPDVNGVAPLILIRLKRKRTEYYGCYSGIMKRYCIGPGLIDPKQVKSWRYPTKGEQIIYERQKNKSKMNENIIRFRPFRYSKKHKAIIVTDYRKWNKVRHDCRYSDAVVVVPANLFMVLEMQCYDYRMRPLYFPKQSYSEMASRGYDCEGTPALNHYYRDEYASCPEFEPLTTSRVVREFNEWVKRMNIKIIKQLQ